MEKEGFYRLLRVPFIPYGSHINTMSTEINNLFKTFKELGNLLNKAKDKAGKALDLAEELSGEFDQEISIDMEAIQEKLRSILDDLDSSYEEARTLWDDEQVMEKSLEDGLDDEENYKTDNERIQEEIEEKEAKS